MSFETNYFSFAAGSEIYFSDDVSIVLTVFWVVAWPFTGKCTGKLCDVTILLPGAPNDGFLLNAFKSLFRLSRVQLFNLKKCIINGAVKFVSVPSILVELEAFRNCKGLSVILSKS